MPRLALLCFVLLMAFRPAATAADPTVAIAVTSNGQAVAEGQTVSGVLNITVTVTDGIGMHVAAYGNMILLPFNEHGHAPNTPVWSRTTQVDTARFFDGENLLSVHVHPHNVAGQPYTTDFTVGLFTIVSENNNPAPNGDRLLPTLEFDSYGWEPTLVSGGYQLSGNARVIDDRSSSTVDRSQSEATSIQMIAHLGESVLGRFRWNTLTPPFGDSGLVSQCHLRPFQGTTDHLARVVVFFTDGAGRANYAFKSFTVPALDAAGAADLPGPMLDAKILGLGEGGTLRIPDGGTTPLYVEIRNLGPQALRFTDMTTWIGNRAVHVTKLLPLLASLPEGETSVIVEVPLPAAEVVKIQAARTGGEQTTAMPIWIDFNTFNLANLPTSSHVHLNSLRTVGYPWPYGTATIVIRSPWNGSAHWTGTSVTVDYDHWGPLPSGYRIRSQVDGGAWTEDDGDGRIVLSGLTRGSHRIDLELVDAGGARLPGTSSIATTQFTVKNARPQAVADVHTGPAGTTLTVAAPGVLANDSDLESDTLTAVLVRAPRHGTASLNSDGSFTYIPATGWIGFDRFTYRASDGSAQSAETEVRIQVQPPIAGSQIPGDWPMIGRDAKHSNAVPGVVGSTAPSLGWTRAAADLLSVNGMVVSGNRVVVTGSTTALALDAGTGQQAWSTALGGGSLSGPASDGTAVFVQRANHSGDSFMHAIDLVTGQVRWSTAYADQWGADTAPTVADGTVWTAGGYYGGLYGYDAATGSERFFTPLPFWTDWTPAYRTGQLFAWFADTVYEHDPVSGAIRRTLENSPRTAGNGFMYTMPAIGEDRLVARTERGEHLVACNLTDFTWAWRALPRMSWTASPSIADGIVYALEGTLLAALDLETGRTLGTTGFPEVAYGGGLLQAPIVTRDAVIVSSSAGYSAAGQTWIIDRASLTIRHTIPHGGWCVLADGALYIAEKSASYGSNPTVFKYVFPVNHRPTIAAASLTVPKNESVTATLATSDAENDPVTLAIAQAPANGAVTILSGSSIRYVPNATYVGNDSFTVTASDAWGAGAEATVSVTVTGNGDIGTGTGLNATYFGDMTLTNALLTRTDAQIAFDWGHGSPAAGTVPVNGFSVRWTGTVQAQHSETYTFSTMSDDGVRLWINGQQLVDNWTDHGPTENSGTIALTAGVSYPIVMEYYENGGGAVAQLSWSSPSTAKTLIPQSQLYPSAEVAIAPAITAQPGATTVGVGTTATFTVGASGTPSPTFQWQRNVAGTWTAISGATSATYSLTASTADHGAQFRAVATNSAGTATSSAVTLSVISGLVDTTDGGLGTVSARGQNGTAEGMLKAFDDASGSKWLDFAPDAATRASWIQYTYATGTLHRVTSYTIRSANDAPARDPRDWALLGSNDGGATWTPVDARTGESFPDRFQQRTFSVTTPDYYKAYRLRIDAVLTPASANSVQLSEIELLSAEPALTASGG